jgi:hypothetical protein
MKKTVAPHKFRAWRYVIESLLLLSATAALLWGLLYRASSINSTFGDSIGCLSGCFTYSVILHDLAFLSTALLVLVLSVLARQFFARVILRVIFGVLLLIYITDTLVLEQFFTRLGLDHIKIYGGQIALVWEQFIAIQPLHGQAWAVLVLALAIAAFLFFPVSVRAGRKASLLLVALPLSGLIVSGLTSPTSYVHDWALRNVIAANLINGVSTPYSESFKQQMMDSNSNDDQICRAGQDRQPNIILLILESWSPYQSYLLSGLNNWTPNIDQIARENSWYTRMHAGGFSTNEGLISLFTGLDFISPAKNWLTVTPFETAWNTDETVPSILQDHGGYLSAFLTSGDLSFSRKREWLQTIGFDHIEGHDYSGYDHIKKRSHFRSVPDRILLARSLELISMLEAKPQPYFVAIETVSTHHPYIHPETGERSQEAVFRYMDETTSEFYRDLTESGFFDDGVLIITSDHRAMIPIPEDEAKRFGQATASLIPMIVAGVGGDAKWAR